MEEEDPFFAVEPVAEGGPGDVSEHVDDYLYGDKCPEA